MRGRTLFLCSSASDRLHLHVNACKYRRTARWFSIYWYASCTYRCYSKVCILALVSCQLLFYLIFQFLSLLESLISYYYYRNRQNTREVSEYTGISPLIVIEDPFNVIGFVMRTLNALRVAGNGSNWPSNVEKWPFLGPFGRWRKLKVVAIDSNFTSIWQRKISLKIPSNHLDPKTSMDFTWDLPLKRFGKKWHGPFFPTSLPFFRQFPLLYQHPRVFPRTKTNTRNFQALSVFLRDSFFRSPQRKP